MRTEQDLSSIDTSDFNEFLHALRSRELARLPPGARAVLSGGCAGTWYFDWFSDRYGDVEHHIGVEAFSPEPSDLPANVEWLQRSLGDLGPIADGEVDLVFAGQVIEHLWPDDVSGFLVEAHRVLRPGGHVVIDSPNRRVTELLGWTQPEHTIEFTVDEIVELLELAGFDQISVRGIWLCFDSDRERVLPLAPEPEVDGWPWDRRVEEAAERPEEAFLWWVEAARRQHVPDAVALRARVRRLYEVVRPLYYKRLRSEVGHLTQADGHTAVTVGADDAGYLLRGPSIAMPPGRWIAAFWLARAIEDGRPQVDGSTLATVLDVSVDDGEEIARLEVPTDALPSDGRFCRFTLPFALDETRFSTEFRVYATGATPVSARLEIEVGEDGNDALDATVSDQAEVRVDDAPVASIDPSRPVSSPGPSTAASVPPSMAPAPKPSSKPTRLARAVGRALLWPFIRFFDPRFQGLAAQADAHHEDLVHHAEIIRGEVMGEREVAAERHSDVLHRFDAAANVASDSFGRLEHLYTLHLDASNEATELVGRALSDLLREADELRASLEQTAGEVRGLADDTRGLYVERATNRPVDDLDGRVAHLLNHAAGHTGYAAQRGLWFNPPISLSYREGDVAASSTNERILETPYVLRALAQLGSGGRILDVGAAENTLAFSLASLGYEVTALDLRPYPLEHRRLTSVVAPIQEWKTDEQFDAVLLLSTLEHIGLGAYGEAPIPGRPDVDALNRVRELTAPDGLLVLTVPYGATSADERQRSYDGPELRSLLASCEIVDFTVARRTDELTWEIDESPPDTPEDDVERVALITATQR